MKRPSFSDEFKPLVALVLLVGAAFSLACRLAGPGLGLETTAGSVVGRVLVASRTAVSAKLYETADLYFHRGVPLWGSGKIAFYGTLQKWAHDIAPVDHVHPEGEHVQEIMPWLRFATQVDPDNVEAYLVASFWMSGNESRRPDLALDILREALRHHPRDYRIYNEKGRVHLIMQDAKKAAIAFDAGISLWPSDQDAEDEGVRNELAQMITYRAFLYELDGDAQEAVRLLERAGEMFPENRAIAQRIEDLQHGDLAREWAEKAWQEFFPLKDACGREGHEGDHDHEHVHGPECGHLSPSASGELRRTGGHKHDDHQH
jgi:tetratricopeptide (TPR) repeat protein